MPRLNPDALGRMLPNAPDARDKVLRSFSKNLSDTLPVLQDAFLRSDRETIRAVAHRMLGTCKFVGANDLASLFQEVERASASSIDQQSLGLNWQDVESEMVGLIEELRSLDSE